jgi:hypothetical protein
VASRFGYDQRDVPRAPELRTLGDDDADSSFVRLELDVIDVEGPLPAEALPGIGKPVVEVVCTQLSQSIVIARHDVLAAA